MAKTKSKRNETRDLNKKLKKVSKLFSYLETVLPKIEWSDTQTLQPINKNLLQLHGQDLKPVKDDDTFNQFLVDHEIHVLGDKKDQMVKPYYTLADTIFPSGLQNELKKKGIFKPTPVQSLSWPTILSGNNYIAISKMGNERTLSYCLPALLHANYKLENKSPDNDECLGPSVLIVTSNKSRAIQIQNVFTDFANVMNMKSCFIYGDKFQNAETEPTLENLKQNPAVLIVTLGRNIMNLLGNDKTNLKNCTFLVLDDIDRILSVKNERFLDKLLNQVRPDRQTIIWTAVDPIESANIRKCIDKIGFNDFIQVHFGSFNQFTKSDCIKQIIDVVSEENDKDDKMYQLIPTILSAVTTAKPKLLVFVDSLNKLRKVGELMYRMGLTTRCLKVEKPVAVETESTKTEVADTPAKKDDEVVVETPTSEVSFYENEHSHITIATDYVAYDDLDLASVNFIINYDFPFNRFENYEERIAKYKSLNTSGTVFTFFNQENNLTTAKKLVDFLIASDQYVNPKIVLPLKEKRQLAAKATETSVKQVKQAAAAASTAATNGGTTSANAVKPATPNKGNGPRFRVNPPRQLNHRGPGFVGPGMGFGYGNFNNGFNHHPLFNNNGFNNGFSGQHFGNNSFGPGGWAGNNDFHRNRPARKFF